MVVANSGLRMPDPPSKIDLQVVGWQIKGADTMPVFITRSYFWSCRIRLLLAPCGHYGRVQRKCSIAVCRISWYQTAQLRALLRSQDSFSAN